MNLVHVPCSEIRSDPASRGYPDRDVDALAASIRTIGLLRPILVCATADGYRIIHGELRWRAAKALGHATIVAWLVLDVLHKSGGAL